MHYLREADVREGETCLIHTHWRPSTAEVRRQRQQAEEERRRRAEALARQQSREAQLRGWQGARFNRTSKVRRVWDLLKMMICSIVVSCPPIVLFCFQSQVGLLPKFLGVPGSPAESIPQNLSSQTWSEVSQGGVDHFFGGGCSMLHSRRATC